MTGIMHVEHVLFCFSAYIWRYRGAINALCEMIQNVISITSHGPVLDKGPLHPT